jgi:NAD+ synthase (glutamine-hydrolysing)
MTMRTEPLRVSLAQINAVVGDISGNAQKIREYIERARGEDAQLVVFPELALTGYPPEDLLLKTHFVDAAGAALEEIARDCEDIVALVGFPERRDDVYNAAAVLADGQVQAVYRKQYLPNYGVFDEDRYFQSGTEPASRSSASRCSSSAPATTLRRWCSATSSAARTSWSSTVTVSRSARRAT